MEPGNTINKYAVAGMNKDKVEGKNGKFAEIVYFFENRCQQYGDSEDEWERCE